MRRAAPVGASSLLVIFSVLCLTIFALLSLSTVRANGALSDAAAQAVEAYYAADCAAEELLAQLRSGIVPEGVTVEEGRYCYRLPVTETAHLEVCVRLDGARYTVLRWQLVSDGAWEPETGLPVWNGEEN